MKGVFAAIGVLLVLVVGAILWVVTRPEEASPSRPKAPSSADGSYADTDDSPTHDSASPPDRPRRETPKPNPSTTGDPTSDAQPKRPRVDVEPEEPAQATGWVGGRVVDSYGKAIEGATVYRIDAATPSANSQDPSFRTVSDADGHWKLPVYQDATSDIGAAKSGFMPTLLRDVALNASGERDNVDLVLGEGASITGKITNPQGQGMPGIRLTAGTDGASPIWRETDLTFLPGRSLVDKLETIAKTDDKGEFAIRGLVAGADYVVKPDSGKYLVMPGPEGQVEDSRRVTAPADGIDFVMVASVQVSVKVVDQDSGEPIPSFNVMLSRRTERNKNSTSTSVANSPDGTVRFERYVTPGPYQLTAEAKGYEPYGPRDEDLPSTDAPYELLVKMRKVAKPPSGSIQITLKDDSGAPARGHAFAMCLDEPAAPGRSGSAQIVTGLGEIKDLDPGRYRVDVRPQGSAFQMPAHLEVDVRSGEASPLDVTVDSGGRIALDVKDPEGHYLSDVRVQVVDGEGRQQSVVFEVTIAGGQKTSRSDGIYHPGRAVTGPILAGVYKVTLWCSGCGPHDETAEVRRGEDTLLSVVLSPQR